MSISSPILIPMLPRYVCPSCGQERMVRRYFVPAKGDWLLLACFCPECKWQSDTDEPFAEAGMQREREEDEYETLEAVGP